MHAQLQSHGYVYVNIDDGWYSDLLVSCDQYGRLIPDPVKFPNGIKAVADYVHSLGLKFGIYEKPDIPKAAVKQNTPIFGTNYHAQDIVVKPYTVPWPAPQLDLGTYQIDWSKPGAQEYIQSCANKLASWGVDYVKLDWVNATINLNTDLPVWGTALKNTGRPIYFSISNYLQVQPPYGAQIEANANGWRDNPDVETYNGNNPDGFNLPITDWGHVTDPSRLANGQQQSHTVLGGPGGWNDEDSLEMGWGPTNTGLTPGEKQYMYGYWCITTSPLLLGCDLRNIDATDLKTLQNDWVIDCDQAPYEPTFHHMSNSNWQWYSKPSGDGGYYILLDNILNPADPGNPGTISVNFSSDLGLSGPQPVWDLFVGKSLGSNSSYTVSLAGHTAVLIKVGGNAPAGNPNGGGGTVGGCSTITNGLHKTVNRNSGLALDDPNGVSGSTIDQQPYGGANQQWTVTASGSSYYTIKNGADLHSAAGRVTYSLPRQVFQTSY